MQDGLTVVGNLDRGSSGRSKDGMDAMRKTIKLEEEKQGHFLGNHASSAFASWGYCNKLPLTGGLKI